LSKLKGHNDDLYNKLKNSKSLEEIEKTKDEYFKKKQVSEVDLKAKEDAEFEKTLDVSLSKLDELLPEEQREKLKKEISNDPPAPLGPGGHWALANDDKLADSKNKFKFDEDIIAQDPDKFEEDEETGTFHFKPKS